LPKDKNSLVEQLQAQGIIMEEDFSISPERLQTPLSVALGASPLFLLAPRLLANVSLGKPKILEVGNTVMAYGMI
jgi:hypothetical protein